MATHAAPADRRQRLTAATIPWRFAVWILFAVTLWEAMSLIMLGGTSSYGGRAYIVLRHLMPGGIRSYGIVLAAVLMASVYAYGRAESSPRERLLSIGLAGFAAWYVAWVVGILSAWIVAGHAGSVGALGLNFGMAALAMLASWFTPKPSGG
jgi:hypothetical protein